MIQDLCCSLRMLLKHPGLAVTAILSLALAIGANTALFSVINAILLPPLLFAQPERLVYIENSGIIFNDAPDQAPTQKDPFGAFEQAAIYELGKVTLTGVDIPVRIKVMRTTGGFFPMLGINPLMGRVFSAEEQKTGQEHVVVISYGLWQNRFGADPSVLNKVVAINGYTFTIIGVMPRDFYFYVLGEKADAWVPLRQSDRLIATEYISGFGAGARLMPGLSLAQAQAKIDTVVQHVLQQRPELKRIQDQRVRLVPLHEKWVGNLRFPLFILLGAVGCVLLIACANTANLLLVSAATRQKEGAIRAALGASRLRLMRQLLTESSLLALLGGGVGLIFAAWGVKLMVAISPVRIPRVDEVGVNIKVVSFTLAISLIAGLLFGLAPAWQFSRPNLNAALKEGGSRSIIEGSPRLRNLLVILEVAIALVLLISAGLLVKSFRKVLDINPGFDPHNVLTLELSPMATKYSDAQQRASFYQQIIERARSLFGVQYVGTVNYLPISSGSFVIPIDVQERSLPPDRPLSLSYRVASSDYFRAMGIQVIAGRYFTERDGLNSSRVVILEETAANLLKEYVFPNESIIGKHLILNFRGPLVHEIVGVVSDVKHRGLETQIYPALYLHSMQRPLSNASLAIRTTVNPASLTGAVRNALWEVDKDIPVDSIKTMEQQVTESMSQRRFPTFLSSIFAAVALLLSSIGICGVMLCTVAQRMHEIGVRRALGAQSQDVLKLIVGWGMGVILVGVALGFLVALALSRVLSRFLYGMSSTDPATLVSSVLLLVMVGLLACYLPVRRALKIDPMISLRYE